MKMWLLVADGVRGRLFEVDRQAKKLVEIKEFLNPEGRLYEKELSSDAPGKTFDREGRGRHALEDSEKKKEQSKEQFAHELAKYLDEKYKTEKINRLVIVAPSKILGYMNHKFNKLNCKHNAIRIAKDMASLSAAEIFNTLEDELLAHKLI
jgi:protein required for attachment to host cells